MAKKLNTEITEVEENAEVKEVKKTAKKSTKKVEEALETETPEEMIEAKKPAKKPAKKVTETSVEEIKEDAKEEVKEEMVEVNEEVKEEPKEEVKEPVEPVAEEPIEVSVEQKLVALYTLQQVDSKIDEIRAYRGNLPLEIQDLEDQIAGLETRIDNLKVESKQFQRVVSDYTVKIKETKDLVKKYEDQQNNVRNNREYDSLTKEIEYQNLDIQVSEKRIKEAQSKIAEVDLKINEAHQRLDELNNALKEKKEELSSLVEGTEKEEEQLLQRSAECEKLVEDRLLVAYKRIRKNARNGLAVVGIHNEACGGCFNRIPPQHQLDICTHKKIIVCEYCGRILVDKDIIAQYNA